MKQYLYAGAVVGLVLSFVGGAYHGANVKDTEWVAKSEKIRADSAQEARDIERKQQEAVNNALQEQYNEISNINSTLLTDINQLRNRPERKVGLPNSSKANCQGASGADLSRADARFLIREASRADKYRAALKSCYAYADSL